MKSQSEFEDDNQENSTSPTWEELDDDDIANKSIPLARTRAQIAKNKHEDIEKNSEIVVAENMNKQKTVVNEDDLYKKRFNKVLLFLWGIIKEPNIVKPTRLSLCTKTSTEVWLDELHDKHLKSMTLQQQQSYTSSIIQDESNLNNAAVAIHKLSDIWERKISLEE